MRHWKQHKADCTWIKEMHDKWKESISKVLPDETVLDTKKGPCAICLEETITNPVTMPCGHIFCFACVGRYQVRPESKDSSCPYCRRVIPNVIDKGFARMRLYSSRAQASPKGSDDCIKYAKLALAENHALIEVMEKDTDEVEPRLKMKYMSVEFTSMTAQPLETINIANEVLSLNDKHSGILDFETLADTKCLLAQAYAALGRWEEAGKIYRSVHATYTHNEQLPSLDYITGCCEAMYETRGYDAVIKGGKLGLNMARYWPGVHKYVALSQKAKGDIDGAKLTMSQAILYEYHWDKDNLQKNKQILRELNDL